ncbi:hypothetical protein BDZ91DRAFT_655011 [Kalaharituber pfeilii]|nr:hypothetical protein BDZ91DRAFT_655011 [Kalaharituber pfeilii]
MDIDSLRARLTEKELYVAVLYGGLKASYRPHPKMRLWMDFGFCTCRLEDGFQREEAELGDLYMQLFDNCTSTEFLRAFTDETLEQLAKRKGFSAKINELGRREIYLQPKPYSVYNLKQFIAVGDFGRDPTLAVQWDYGYLRCRNAGERMQWTETYKKVFQSHEHRDLQLHQACIKGKIFEYVKRISPDTPKSFESLCRNAYPLKEH